MYVVCARVCACVRACVSVSVCVCAYACVCVCGGGCLSVCLSVCVCVSVSVCLCVSVSVIMNSRKNQKQNKTGEEGSVSSTVDGRGRLCYSHELTYLLQAFLSRCALFSFCVFSRVK